MLIYFLRHCFTGAKRSPPIDQCGWREQKHALGRLLLVADDPAFTPLKPLPYLFLALGRSLLLSIRVCLLKALNKKTPMSMWFVVWPVAVPLTRSSSSLECIQSMRKCAWNRKTYQFAQFPVSRAFFATEAINCVAPRDRAKLAFPPNIFALIFTHTIIVSKTHRCWMLLGMMETSAHLGDGKLLATLMHEAANDSSSIDEDNGLLSFSVSKEIFQFHSV